MSSRTARLLRVFVSLLSVLALFALVLAIWFYVKLRASLPELEGRRPVAGLSAPVTVGRDARGVPVIRGANRADVARALGFAHAQDRFFQMDLMRRRAAGELAELFGEAALPLDRRTRLHGFRKLAETVVARSDPAERTLLDAYTAGVNAGLAALGAKPFEYVVQRVDPVAWRPEDSVLVSYAITLDMQDKAAPYEQTLSTLRDTLGSAVVPFFAPLVGPADAALDGTTAPLPPLPDARIIDLRKRPPATAGAHAPPAVYPPGRLADLDPATAEDVRAGSNNFALAGPRTASGVALLANDMHLGLGVPNTWYQASLVWTDAAAPGGERRVTGATLPGTPAVIAGSNGRIAWGLTNSYIDTVDHVVVDVNSVAPDSFYARGGDMLEFEKRKETIRVKGGDPVEIETRWTVWGPIVGKNLRERPLALKWTAHDPATTDFRFIGLERATTVTEAIAAAHQSGVTPLNLLVADDAGTIGWTILGKIPKRVGFDGRLPVTWTYGDRRWDGYLSPAETPTVITDGRTPPPVPLARPGQLYTANARVLGGEALAKLGDGSYDAGARAAQIRDALSALSAPATPRDLLALQLDDRALFLARWETRLRALLTDDAVARHDERRELRTLLDRGAGRASVDSVSHRLVRAWRSAVARRVFDPIFRPCVAAYPDFDFTMLAYEQPLWTLLEQKPAHLLDPGLGSWQDLELAAVDDVIAQLDKQGIALAQATWGERNRARIQHPFSRFAPAWAAAFLDMPADPLPGDTHLPRVQGPAFGASQRLVVEPGREAEGIYHQPGGASGHPLSPFYRAGHAAWVNGEPTPFLPGAAVHTLTLTP